MKDRIKQIMDSENLTPSAFADKLEVGRAIISHILNGRNNPSLDIVTRILEKISNIEPSWLLSGNGTMYKSAQSPKTEIQEQPTSYEKINKYDPDLFSQNSVNTTLDTDGVKYGKDLPVDSPKISVEPTENKVIEPTKSTSRKVTRIIIYYNDNTFEVFNPDHKPL